MDSIVNLFTSLPSAKVRKDDDFSDRLSSRYTVILLIVFAVIVSMHQYVGDPIKCWVPAHFTGSHTSYTNSYCWVKNTYYLPYLEDIPKPHEDRQSIPYYQWIPFIMLTQAVFFYIPSIVWHSLNQRAGVDADNILATANTFNQTDKVENRDSTLRVIRNQMNRFLVSRKGVGKQSWKTFMTERTFMGRSKDTEEEKPVGKFGAYLNVLYLVSKVLYLLNVIGQLFVLNRILRTRYSWYGIQVLSWMSKDDDWHNSPYVTFPRVTMCDFNIRRLGNVHAYTVQCTLPINLYNEKIYMFLWFWMLFVAVITIISLFTWLARACMPGDRIRYVQNHLRMADCIETESEFKAAEKFVKSYLRPDGVFLLRLIGHNTNSITVTEVIEALWNKWEKRPIFEPTLSEDPSAPPGAMELTPLKEKEIPED